MKQSGGSILVYSEVGVGSTFKIYLPRLKAADNPRRKENADTEISRGSETILLVEDEEALRQLTERILQHAGYTVLSAANGPEALTLAEEAGYRLDLILTDVIMPGISGGELVRRLHEQHEDLRTLFMSGYTDTAVAVHGVLEKGVHLLGKPFTAAQLTRKVREVLEGKRQSAGN